MFDYLRVHINIIQVLLWVIIDPQYLIWSVLPFQDVLFPLAKSNVRRFLERNWDTAQCQEDVLALKIQVVLQALNCNKWKSLLKMLLHYFNVNYLTLLFFRQRMIKTWMELFQFLIQTTISSRIWMGKKKGTKQFQRLPPFKGQYCICYRSK